MTIPFLRYCFVFYAVVLCNLNSTIAQSRTDNYPSAIYEQIKKLNFLGSALFVAAHPDDENTRLISYLTNQVHARTAYLSLTRGDGGQNLIGLELKELLGVLRTQELLAARRIDGGSQIFSRANDFGYSKHPNETLKIWDKEKVLADMVWAIRTFKPDVIINRFGHKSAGKTHGHHTASAILSLEAFDVSNQKNMFPEQLELTTIWQPKRLFFNTSWWFYGSRSNFKKADKSKMVALDVGVYYPAKGKSNNEIASLASSQHLCQGFGRLSQRGSQKEYLESLKGSLPKNNDIFEGINTTWSRIKGGKAIGEILYKVEKSFNFKNPSEHIASLIEAYKLIQKLENTHWKEIKSKEILQIIQQCAGLYIEATAKQNYATPGETIPIQIEAINRADVPLVLKNILIRQNGQQKNVIFDKALKYNIKNVLSTDYDIPNSSPYSNAYWLNQPWNLGMYVVDKQELIGKSETPPAVQVTFYLECKEIVFPITKSLVYRYSKPDKGERYEPFNILPKATVKFSEKVFIFTDTKPKEIPVIITAHQDQIKGKATLDLPKGWQIEPKEVPFKISKKGGNSIATFKVVPTKNTASHPMEAQVFLGNKKYNQALHTIAYDHIPTQSVLLPAIAKAVRLNLKKSVDNIGYIMGAGDAVPESLRQIGYRVTLIEPSEITTSFLEKFDAVILGIRAYNVIDILKFKKDHLFKYTENGGNLIVQYNTTRGWNNFSSSIAPYPIELSRDRVTDESSEVDIIAPKHELMRFPNVIKPSDFEGWVQERGLYFPRKWDAAFTPILSMHDKGEQEKKGSLLIAPYGKGNYIYTGLSFFRELPAGVPGAYKLFANMLSVGKNNLKNYKSKNYEK